MLPIRLIPEVLSLSVWSGPISIFLVKATIVLAAGCGLTRSMARSSAGARHLVWLAILATLLVMPALTTWARLEIPVLPPLATATHTARPSVSDATRPVVVPSVSASQAVGDATLPASDAVAVDAVPVPDEPTPLLSRVLAMPIVSLLAIIWAAGVLCILVSLVWSSLAVRRIVRRAHALEQADWRTPLLEVSDRLGLDEPPRLLVSRDTNMPFACGVLEPTIVLPEDSRHWPLARRRAVLLHELAHVRRRDLLGHVLGRVVCAFYWFHPLAWIASRRLRLESEQACDDLAIACGTRATDYAEHLLDIVVSVRVNAIPVVALAMARRREFEGRMLAILDPERPHSTPSRRQSMALMASLALSAGLVAAAAPVPRASVVAAEPATRGTASTIPNPGRRAADRIVVSSDRRLPTGPGAAAMIQNGIGQAATRRTQGTVSGNAGSGARAPLGSPAPVPVASPAPISVAAIAGANQGTPDDRAGLLAKVLRSDSSARLRRIAAWGLEQHAESQTAVDALVYALKHDADAAVREMAAWSLSSADDHHDASDALAAALRTDASERVRATAAWSLGNVGSSSRADALTAALSDSSREVRMRAAWALGNVEPKQAPPALVGMLKDRDQETRRLVAWSLYQIEDPSALPALEAALKTETDQETQLDYVRAIAVMGDKSVDAIRALLDSSDPAVKSAAVRALAGGHAGGPWPWPWPEPRPEP